MSGTGLFGILEWTAVRRSLCGGGLVFGVRKKRSSLPLLWGRGCGVIRRVLAGGGDFSALLAVNQLEEKVEQEVAAKDANRQKNCEGHGGLARA